MTVHAVAGVAFAMIVGDALGLGRQADGHMRGSLALFTPLMAISLGRAGANDAGRRWWIAALVVLATMAVGLGVVSTIVFGMYNWPVHFDSQLDVVRTALPLSVILFGVVQLLTALDRASVRAKERGATRGYERHAAWLALAMMGAIGAAAVLSRVDGISLELHETLSVGAFSAVCVGWIALRDVPPFSRMREHRLGLALALSGFLFGMILVYIEFPSWSEARQPKIALLLPVVVACGLGLLGLLLGAYLPVAGRKRTLAIAVGLSPLFVLIGTLAAIQFEILEAYFAFRAVAGFVMVIPLIVFTWLRTSVPLDPTSPAAPSLARATWTAPALLLASIQIYLGEASGWEQRSHRPHGMAMAGLLATIALLVFVIADGRLAKRLGRTIGSAEEAASADARRLAGFQATQIVRTNLAWNVVCFILAAGCLAWAIFNGVGTYIIG